MSEIDQNLMSPEGGVTPETKAGDLIAEWSEKARITALALKELKVKPPLNPNNPNAFELLQQAFVVLPGMVRLFEADPGNFEVRSRSDEKPRAEKSNIGGKDLKGKYTHTIVTWSLDPSERVDDQVWKVPKGGYHTQLVFSSKEPIASGSMDKDDVDFLGLILADIAKHQANMANSMFENDPEDGKARRTREIAVREIAKDRKRVYEELLIYTNEYRFIRRGSNEVYPDPFRLGGIRIGRAIGEIVVEGIEFSTDREVFLTEIARYSCNGKDDEGDRIWKVFSEMRDRVVQKSEREIGPSNPGKRRA
ncbi:MAG: hypothetical protein ACOX50_00595 [Patescibacteria group bacterium]|jgi:hypothetical protein